MARAEFTAKIKEQAFARYKGLCGACQQQLQPPRVQYDHIIPDRLGGKPELANCMPMCTPCHRIKTAEQDAPRIAKGRRQGQKNINARTAPAKKIESAPFAKSEKVRVKRESLPPRPMFR